MKTTSAPIQYMKLEYWPYWSISPTNERGIVSDNPTVTTSGVVRSIASAHEMSLINDDNEFVYRVVSLSYTCDCINEATYKDNGPDPSRRRHLKLYHLSVKVHWLVVVIINVLVPSP